MLTTAVLAICITAPAGAIMINTLGTKWLSYDGDDLKDGTDREDNENQDTRIHPAVVATMTGEHQSSSIDPSQKAKEPLTHEN